MDENDVDDDNDDGDDDDDVMMMMMDDDGDDDGDVCILPNFSYGSEFNLCKLLQRFFVLASASCK